MADPWVWRQPTNQAELLSRLADARDLDVPERERENLCACAHEEIVRLRGQADIWATQRASYLEDLRSGDRALDDAKAETARLWERYEASEAEISRLTAERDALGAEVARLTAEVDQARSFLAANERGWQGTFARLENELSVARHTIESWQREVGGREADIDRLRALLVRCVPALKLLLGYEASHGWGSQEYSPLLPDIERVLGGGA